MIRGVRGGPLRAFPQPLVVLAVVIGTSATAPQSGLATAERNVAVMGTSLYVAVRAPDREKALAASEVAVAEVRRVESLLTTWGSNSALARLNAAPAGNPFTLDPELSAVLSQVFAWSISTRRAFDPTVLPLVRAWGLRGNGRIPSRDELDAALAATGPDRFRFDPARGTVTRIDPSAGIDEGAWGKGYALERAADRLLSAGATNALLDLGGQVLARGKDGDGKDWTIAIAHPAHRHRPVVVLALSNLSASTSGNSERGREVSHRRIGHLLDPRTGEPAADFGSVTVLAPSALVADVLSTAFFVLGPTEGLAISARLRTQGTPHEVLFLVEHGDGLEAVASPGAKALVLSADASVRGLTTQHP
jgi:thiamine biosynthesis lipoprotein